MATALFSMLIQSPCVFSLIRAAILATSGQWFSHDPGSDLGTSGRSPQPHEKMF
jgi:hypothetical protein